MSEPWPDMFDAEVMEALNRLLNIKSPESAKADFLVVGEHIRTIIDITPSNFDRGPKDIPLSRRARWLARRVMKPAALLREALLDDPKFAEYPDSYANSISSEERREIVSRLATLEAFANQLHDDLDYRAKQKNLRHNIEMRREFLFWIAQVVAKHAQDISKERSYTSAEINGMAGRGNAAPFFSAVKLAYVQITGEKARQLDDHFKEIVRMNL
ncbi:hypothetical protein [Erythrobacter sp. SAORIC-644]|uniref:hypothetical protein n=1 Tax=Erythrobacter sp. SAORIC-644 TaxID=1869314 RepID=UPI001304A8CA|nr:hypothetical protein [Erythrobacter sp. SAORIC-644]